MKYTLLEMTQNILSSMDSDEVTSISDTTEATQVAEIIRTSYFNIISRANLPEHMDTFSLDASGDDDLPVLMTRPTDVTRIDWIKYNKKLEDTDPDNFQYVTIIPFEQFVDHMHQLNTDETNVGTYTFNGHTYYYKNDYQPQFCTIINDLYVLFDNIDMEIDLTTLQSDKTICYGQVVPNFTLSDTFTPELDDLQFPLLLNEAKSLAFLELKQITHEQAITESRRHWRGLQQSKELVKPNYLSQLPNFGRK